MTDSSSSAHCPLYSDPMPPPEDEDVEPNLIFRPRRAAPILHTPSDPPATSFAPICRPKRGQANVQLVSSLRDKYHEAGRKLKYSGIARFCSTYPPSHKAYRPIANAPPPSSMYHIHGRLIANLELMEALVMFVYSAWCNEYSPCHCNPDTWLSMDGFINWCKAKWTPEEGSSDVEKAFYGLIYMFNAFIHARVVAHYRCKVHSDLRRVTEVTRQAVGAAIADAGTLAGTIHVPPIVPPQLLPPQYRIGAPPSHITAAANTVSASLSLEQLESMNKVASHLNFSSMARQFPRTFARMVHSTLNSSEEHEVDFEDDDGELFWPGQSITGEGLGWLCYMGKAMIREFGEQFQYNGLEGVILNQLN
ncbi:hypothetical protein BT96DRAFT_923556 [Gymnopus androsaceus JB14]|uniref:Uncharacterized protein n=1 Tax=Gymnopus androsaceus JB14 TaxID=1447944 RepID=A0A6A4H9M3_9AGAR|nr:hypothetical protein BT96DRAFT_923556 [Gymnopus androsaceus JB14]